MAKLPADVGVVHKSPAVVVIQGQARFLIRLPDDWNGGLVVAGASGARSEYNGDFASSDYVLQKGYAYASQNRAC